MKKLKCWKDQTSKTQRSMGGTQFIHVKDNTQVSVGQWDFDKSPKNWQFNAHSKEEAGKGYPHQKLGVTKSQALKSMHKFMREHNKC